MVGRPKTGQKPVRTVRLGDIWDEVYAAAAEDGVKVAAWIEGALREALDRRKRRIARAAKSSN